MRKMKIVILIVALLIGETSMAKEKAKEENLDKVYFLALDGNVKAAMEVLKTLDRRRLTPVELISRRKFLERFGKSVHSIHPSRPDLVSELTAVYQSYWDQVLLQKLDQKQGYDYLFKKLAPIVHRLGGKAGRFSESEYDRVSEFLTAELNKTGYYAKIGVVKPHLNFMAWKKQTVKPYLIKLGIGEIEKVKVVLMDDFVSLGWAAYATFDKMHVGGWVETHALYCVASSYDLQSENFKVSFLAHEARHFSDLKRYKNLNSSDLEYRAKLNEIFLSDKSFKDLMRKFIQEQKNNLQNPHSHASYRLITRLSEKLGTRLNLNSIQSLSKKEIQKIAKALLVEDTRRLDNLLKFAQQR